MLKHKHLPGTLHGWALTSTRRCSAYQLAAWVACTSLISHKTHLMIIDPPGRCHDFGVPGCTTADTGCSCLQRHAHYGLTAKLKALG